MPVKVTIKKNWATQIESGMQRALLEMATDVHKRAVSNAPLDSSALRNSGRIVPVIRGFAVIFGSTRVPYARIHELGGTIKPRKGKFLAWKDPSSPYANKDGWVFAKSVKISAKNYLGRAGDSVARGDKSKYFRNKLAV